MGAIMDTSEPLFIYNEYTGIEYVLAYSGSGTASPTMTKVSGNDTWAQWLLTDYGAPYTDCYRLHPVNSGDVQGYSLDVNNSNGVESSGLDIVQTARLTGQVWVFTPAGNGGYRISNNFTGPNMAIGAQQLPFTNVFLSGEYDSSQHWHLVANLDDSPNASVSTSSSSTSQKTTLPTGAAIGGSVTSQSQPASTSSSSSQSALVTSASASLTTMTTNILSTSTNANGSQVTVTVVTAGSVAVITSSPDSSTGSSSNKLSTGAIAGLAIGAFAALVLLAGLILWWRRSSPRKQNQVLQQQQSPPPPFPSSNAPNNAINTQSYFYKGDPNKSPNPVPMQQQGNYGAPNNWGAGNPYSTVSELHGHAGASPTELRGQDGVYRPELGGYNNAQMASVPVELSGQGYHR